jgi:hypothetical protein
MQCKPNVPKRIFTKPKHSERVGHKKEGSQKIQKKKRDSIYQKKVKTSRKKYWETLSSIPKGNMKGLLSTYRMILAISSSSPKESTMTVKLLKLMSLVLTEDF